MKKSAATTLVRFAEFTTEILPKEDRRVINPALFRALGRTLDACKSFAEFEATLTEGEWAKYVPLFQPKAESTGFMRAFISHNSALGRAGKAGLTREVFAATVWNV